MTVLVPVRPTVPASSDNTVVHYTRFGAPLVPDALSHMHLAGCATCKPSSPCGDAVAIKKFVTASADYFAHFTP